MHRSSGIGEMINICAKLKLFQGSEDELDTKKTLLVYVISEHLFEMSPG